MSAASKRARFDTGRLNRIGSALDERYVKSGKLPGFRLMITTPDETVLDHCAGWADVERRVPVQEDTLYRIYSMTKPLISLLFMMMVEEGHVGLDDPVHRLLPAFRRLRVISPDGSASGSGEPLAAPMRIVDLLRHTAGLTYAVQGETETATAHRARKLGSADGPTGDDLIEELADIALDFSPGEAWNYSIATDVLGHIIEKITGENLAATLCERILSPLGMHDTGFWVKDQNVGRFAASYRPATDATLILTDDPLTSAYRTAPRHHSGGGGLVSTAPDYLRFCRMLVNEGTLDGVRLVGPATIRRMRSNHLPLEADLRSLSRSLFSETSYSGVGFGLGFAVTMKPDRTLIAGSKGDYFWGGMASTLFWIDPLQGFACVFLTQLVPSDHYPLRRSLREQIYGALL